MRIAIFGGSFDPVHSEHIRLAEFALAELSLDKLFIMPAYAPPHKKGKVLSQNEDRLAICRLAFSHLDKVEVSDYEIAKEGVSYTYLTCEHFQSLYSDAEMEFYRLFGKKFAYLSYNGKDISSTKIRVLAGAGMDITEFVPLSVASYIQEKGMYKIPFADQALSLENPKRRAHSLRVAELAAKRAVQLQISERKAITAALLHDCAKNLPADSPYLQGFSLPTEWGEVPSEVAHQFSGAFVCEKYFGFFQISRIITPIKIVIQYPQPLFIAASIIASGS